jgi:hypothetical protein
MIFSTFLAAEPTVTIIVALITAIIGPIIITWFREILTKKKDLIKALKPFADMYDAGKLLGKDFKRASEIIKQLE